MNRFQPLRQILLGISNQLLRPIALRQPKIMVEQFIHQTANDAGILLLGHDSKDGIGYSGSSGWHNSVRQRWALKSTADKQTHLMVAKNNYGKSEHGGRWEWDNTAEILQMREAIGEGSAVSEFAEQAFDDVVHAAVITVREFGGHVPTKDAGPLGGIANNGGVLEMLESVPQTERPAQIRAALRRLKNAGRLTIETYTAKNRQVRDEYVSTSEIDPING